MSFGKSARIVALLLLGGALALPNIAHANFWHKISKAAKSATHAVEKKVHKAGETVHDTGIAIGKEVKKAAIRRPANWLITARWSATLWSRTAR